MRTLFLAIFACLSTGVFGQKLHKLEEIDNVPLTLLPTVFDPRQDSTISLIEFLQDTTAGVYEEKIHSSISKSDGIEKVYGVGLIGDFRIDKKTVSLIIKTHHSNGGIDYKKYTQTIDQLTYFEDFDWAVYSTDVEIYYDGEEDEVHSN